ncbi:hypothetical protein BDP55DRAFT_721283 [Colletotrichum godetiae]|uniref:Uncharacterized protein n=1 Tax=Colletotrichum godetiae TaxID=1209918 RepID=A0AAJ0A6V6_9PEZI|nr:uncharacterized protein BDP55DRAFT_721283 [Colletotrichum godetiae]KAK1657621.1 hypothetical protein BDP55DRAFT_721283 [Colletotrichum godetiae]
MPTIYEGMCHLGSSQARLQMMAFNSPWEREKKRRSLGYSCSEPSPHAHWYGVAYLCRHWQVRQIGIPATSQGEEQSVREPGTSKLVSFHRGVKKVGWSAIWGGEVGEEVEWMEEIYSQGSHHDEMGASLQGAGRQGTPSETLHRQASRGFFDWPQLSETGGSRIPARSVGAATTHSPTRSSSHILTASHGYRSMPTDKHPQDSRTAMPGKVRYGVPKDEMKALIPQVRAKCQVSTMYGA